MSVSTPPSTPAVDASVSTALNTTPYVIVNADPSGDSTWSKLIMPSAPKKFESPEQQFVQKHASLDGFSTKFAMQSKKVKAINQLRALGHLLLLSLEAYFLYDFSLGSATVPQSRVVHMTTEDLVQRMLLTWRNLAPSSVMSLILFSPTTSLLANECHSAQAVIPLVLGAKINESSDTLGVPSYMQPALSATLRSALCNLFMSGTGSAKRSKVVGNPVCLAAKCVGDRAFVIDWNAHCHPITHFVQGSIPIRLHFVLKDGLSGSIHFHRGRCAAQGKKHVKRWGPVIHAFPIRFSILSMRQGTKKVLTSKKRLASTALANCPRQQGNSNKRQRKTSPDSQVPLFLFSSLPVPPAISGRCLAQGDPCARNSHTQTRLSLKRRFSEQSATPMHAVSLRPARQGTVDTLANEPKRIRVSYLVQRRVRV